jgi:transcriptional regulator with XRE-family HTH domain
MQEDAGLNGIQLAERLGWSNTKVSKITGGRQARVTRAEVTAWAQATGYTGDLAELLDSLEDEQREHRRWIKEMRQGGAASVQVDLDGRTRAATRVREVTILLVPGFLQTAAYARCIAEQAASVNGTSDIDAAVTARLQRQQVLQEPGRKFEFIMTEAALRTLVCPRDVMAGQMYQLIAASQLPNVTIGIIPMGVELKLTPLETFLMLDDVALPETYGGDSTLGEGESRVYSDVFDRLMGEAATGDAVRALIVDAAAALR